MAKVHGQGGKKGRHSKQQVAKVFNVEKQEARLDRQHAARLRKIDAKSARTIAQVDAIADAEIKKFQDAQRLGHKLTWRMERYWLLAINQWHLEQLRDVPLVDAQGNITKPDPKQLDLLGGRSAAYIAELRKDGVTGEDIAYQVEKYKRRIGRPGH